MNKKLSKKLQEAIKDTNDPDLSLVKERLVKLDESVIDEVKEAVDAITDVIIEEVVDNKLTGEQMKEHLKRLDMSMDYLTSYGIHCAKMLMEIGDEDMKGMYSKMQNLALKMAEMIKEKRLSLDPQGMYERKVDSFYSVRFGEEDQLRILSEIEKITEDKGDSLVGKMTAYKVALDSVKDLSDRVQSQDKQIKDLKDQITLSEKTHIVEDAIARQKKLLPKQKEWALSLSVEQLKSFLEHAPTINLSDKIMDVVPQDSTMSVELTDFDRETIRTYNLDEKRYIEEKRKRLGK